MDRDPDRTDLPFFLQPFDSGNGVAGTDKFQGGVVELVEIDMIRTEAFQALLTGPAEIVRRKILAVGAGRKIPSSLGRENDPVSRFVFEESTEKELAVAFPVDICRIKKINAGGIGSFQRSEGIFIADRAIRVPSDRPTPNPIWRP